MEGAAHPEPASGDQTAGRFNSTADAAAAARRLAAVRKRHHQDEELDEALRESFPASDPPSSWAGP